MRKLFAMLLIVFAMGLGISSLMAQGQSAGRGAVVVPDSTVEHAADVGLRAHTNHLIFLKSQPSPQASSPSGETPGSLGCVYQVVSPLTSGCPIATSTTNPSGGSGTIAIVDAFDYPTSYNDLTVFSNAFGLPVLPQCSSTVTTSCFQVIYASGKKPRANCGWAQEAALDIEWSHAMAPSAKIVLVEAASNSFANLFAAVDVATSVVTGSGSTGQVSMSWGGSEFSSESTDDKHFTTTGVVYFASSGDTGGKTIYPGVSPNVVCAGGTSVNRTSGNFTSETGWSGSGGGPSAYESIPLYQSNNGIAGTQRGVPDFSFDANPYTGVSVYDSTSCQGLSGWLVFGGTSVASPSLAGIVNLSGSTYNSSDTELNTIYSCYATASCYGANFRDITSGAAGSFSAATGWDFVTGVGSNLGKVSK